MEELRNNESDDSWSLIIRPKASLFDINFREIWDYRDLIWLFVKRDFISQYKQTILGPLWHIIQPLLTTLIYLFLFSNVAKIGTDGIEPPLLFYLSGITIWNYFAACLLSTSSTFVTNASIFGKVYFPRLAIPISIVISNIIRFFIQFSLLVLFMIYYSFKGFTMHWSQNILAIPFLVILLAGMSLGLGIVVSSLTTRYRDLAFFLAFAVQLLMYATPIVYPFSFISGKNYQSVLSLNPLTPICESFRYCLFGRGTFTVFGIIYSSLFALGSIFLGITMFNRVEKDFMDTI